MLLSLRSLKAARMVASDEETRFYLNGVRCEIRLNHVTYIATDGHKLVAIRDTAGGGANLNITIPKDVIDGFKLSARERQNGTPLSCTLEKREDGYWELNYMNHRRAFKPVEGAFPDWKRIVPPKVDGKPAHYNPSYLVTFNKIDAFLHGARGSGKESTLATVCMNGDGPALVKFSAATGDRAFGVIMPVRTGGLLEHPPGWFTAPTTVAFDIDEAA